MKKKISNSHDGNLPSGRILLMMMCIVASVPCVQSLANNNNNNRNSCPSNDLLDMLDNNSNNNNNNKEALGLYGVHDALSARILEAQLPENKNAALFVSGFGISASRLGQPDAGLLTSTELQDSTKQILQRTSSRLPVLVDGDTGFGGAANIRRTIRDVASLKAAAISIEDQTFPKRCTYVAGKGITVLDRAAAKERMQWALAAQQEAYEQDGNQLLIVARTDCRMQLGLQEAIERCLLFEELGADIVYAENLQSQDEYLKLRSKMQESTPMILAQVQTGDPEQTTIWNLQEIRGMGFDMGLFGVSGLQATVSALEQVASEMMQCGGIVQNTPLASLEQVKSVVGFDELDAFQERATTSMDNGNKRRIRSSATALSAHYSRGGSPVRQSLARLSSRSPHRRRFHTVLWSTANDVTEPDDEQGPQAPFNRMPPPKSDETVTDQVEETVSKVDSDDSNDKVEPTETTESSSDDEKTITLSDDTISNLIDPLAASDVKGAEAKSTYDPLKAKFPSPETTSSNSPFAKKGGGSPFAAAAAAAAKKGMSSFNTAAAKKGGGSPFAAAAKKGMSSFDTAAAKKGMSSFSTSGPGKQSSNPFFAKKGSPKGMNMGTTTTTTSDDEIKELDVEEEKTGSKAPAKSSFVPKTSKSDFGAPGSPFTAAKKGMSSFTPPPKGASSFAPPKQSGNPFFAKKGSPKGFAAKTATSDDEIKKESSDDDEESEETTASAKSPFATKSFPKKPAASASVSPFSKDGMASFSAAAKKGMESFSSAAKKGMASFTAPKQSNAPFGGTKEAPKGMSQDSGEDVKELPSNENSVGSSKAEAKNTFASNSFAKSNDTAAVSPFAKKGLGPPSAAKKGFSSFAAPKQSESPISGMKGSPKGMAMDAGDELKEEESSDEDSVGSKAPAKSSFVPKNTKFNVSASSSPFAKKGMASFSAAAKKGMASFTAPKQSTSPFSGTTASPKGSSKDSSSDEKELKKDDSVSPSPFAKKGMASFSAAAKKGMSSFTAPKQSASPFSGTTASPKGFSKDSSSDELKELKNDDSASSSPFAKKGMASFSAAAKKGMASFTAPKQSTSPFSGTTASPKGSSKDSSSDEKELKKDDSVSPSPFAKKGMASFSAAAKKGMSSFTAPKQSASPFSGTTASPKGFSKDSSSDELKELKNDDSASSSPFAKKGMASFSAAAKKGMASFTAPKQSTSPFSGTTASPKGSSKDSSSDEKELKKDDSVSPSPFAKKGMASFSAAAKKGMSSFTAPKQSASPFSGTTASPKGFSKDSSSDELKELKNDDSASSSPFAKKGMASFSAAAKKGMASFTAPKQSTSPFSGTTASPKGSSKDSSSDEKELKKDDSVSPSPFAKKGMASFSAAAKKGMSSFTAPKQSASPFSGTTASPKGFSKGSSSDELKELKSDDKLASPGQKNGSPFGIGGSSKGMDKDSNDRIAFVGENAADEIAAGVTEKEIAEKNAAEEAEIEAAKLNAKEEAESALLAVENKAAEVAEAARIAAEKETAELKINEEAEAARLAAFIAANKKAAEEAEAARVKAEKEAVEFKANEEAEVARLAAEKQATEEAESAHIKAEKEAAELKAKEDAEVARLAAETKATNEAEAARIKAEKEVAELETKEEVEEAEAARINAEEETAKGRRKAVKIRIVELDEEEEDSDDEIFDFETDDEDLLEQIRKSQAALENYSERLGAVLDEQDMISKGGIADSDSSAQPVQVEVIRSGDSTDSRSGDEGDKNSPAYSPDRWFSRFGGKTLDQVSPPSDSSGDGSEAVVRKDFVEGGDGLRPIPQATEHWFDEKYSRKSPAFGMEKTSFGVDQVKGKKRSGDQGRLIPLQDEGSAWYADPRQGLPSRQETSQPAELQVEDATFTKGDAEGDSGDSEQRDEENSPITTDPTLFEPKATWFDKPGVKGPYMTPSSGSKKPEVDESVLRPVDITNSWYSESKGRSKGAYGETSTVQKPADKESSATEGNQPEVREDAPSKIDPSLLQPKATWFDKPAVRGPYMTPSPGSKRKPDADESVLRPVDITNSWYSESKGRSKGAYGETPTVQKPADKESSATEGNQPEVGEDAPSRIDPSLFQPEATWFDKPAVRGPYMTPSSGSKKKPDVDESVLRPVDNTNSWYDESKGRSKGAYVVPPPSAPIKKTPDPDDDSNSFHDEEPKSPPTESKTNESTIPLRSFEQQPRWFDEGSLRKSKKPSQPTNSISDQPSQGEASVLRPFAGASQWFETRKPKWDTSSEPKAENSPPKADDSVLMPFETGKSWFEESNFRKKSTPSTTSATNEAKPPLKDVLIPAATTSSWFDESNYRDRMVGAGARPINPEGPADITPTTDEPSDDQKEEIKLEQEAQQEHLKAKQEMLEKEREELELLRQAEQDRLERLIAQMEAKGRPEEEASDAELEMEQEKAELAGAKQAEEEDRLRAEEKARRSAELEAERKRVQLEQELLEQEKAELALAKQAEKEERLRAAAKSNAELKAKRERLKEQQELLEKEKAEVARAKQEEEDRLRAAEEAKHNAELKAKRERLKEQQELLEKEKAELARAKQEQEERRRAAEEALRDAEMESEWERLKEQQELLDKEKAELARMRQAKLATPKQGDEAPPLDKDVLAAASELAEDSTTPTTAFNPMEGDVGTIGPDTNWRDSHRSMNDRMNDLGDTMNGENW
ncbi:unnamed protein product [Cylindrotheca closterium]|uniref:Uncharacterized protein n=1 Tax=Cylindrotheca closterium TaxID=2856 RepID=A0AAD2FJY9_9STRA|nr:unnamed protein product [Cylindrotheca closterium]